LVGTISVSFLDEKVKRHILRKERTRRFFTHARPRTKFRIGHEPNRRGIEPRLSGRKRCDSEQQQNEAGPSHPAVMTPKPDKKFPHYETGIGAPGMPRQRYGFRGAGHNNTLNGAILFKSPGPSPPSQLSTK
jgi:hypothetical protein